MRESDLILFVVDAQHGMAPIDQDLAGMLRKSKRPVVLVVNKIDHANHEALESDFARLSFKRTIPISAAHGRGISELLETIDRLLPQTEEPTEEPTARKPPVALAIIGRPNAGKSSLINSILKDQRTIVSEIAGTTRDAIDIPYERDGQKFLLIDTAGMRAGASTQPRSKSSA
jgi:GTP-binding protein